MSIHVLRGDARCLPLRDESVDLIICSPPYYSLRSYGAGPGEIGCEAHWRDWLAALVEATAEMARVLKPTGSIFVDLGDTYSRAAGPYPQGSSDGFTSRGPRPTSTKRLRPGGIPEKSLMLLPERYRIACVDQLGLICRAVIVWDKPNCLSGGARVYARLPGGDRPIMLRDLVRHYRTEDTQLWNGHRWTQVLGWSRTADDNGALEIELRSGERIGCTREHRWPTTRGLLHAEDLRIGDVILQSAIPEPDAPHDPAGLPDDDIGWLVGLYIAEGSRSETTIQIAGHAREELRHARLARITATYGGTCNVYRTSENGVTCNLHGTILAAIIDQYVSQGTARTKRLRKAAWQRSNHFLRAVVQGYLDGDGHYDAKNQRWRIGFTANDEWAADLRTLAARLGITLRLRRRTTSFDGRTFPGWGGDLRWQRTVHWNSKPDTEVMAIRHSRARDFYDLGVEDDPHLFTLASGVLTHNSLPESVKDRVRRSHEDWVHLVKQPRYYAALDELREPHLPQSLIRNRVGGNKEKANYAKNVAVEGRNNWEGGLHPLGKLPGSVWPIPSEPLRLPPWLDAQHYAAFGTEWPRRLILGWSPPGICCQCEIGRFPVVERQFHALRSPQANGRRRMSSEDDGLRGEHNLYGGPVRVPGEQCAMIVGYACACTPYTDHPGTGENSHKRTGNTMLDGEGWASTNELDGSYSNYQRVGPWREYHLDRWTPPPTRPAVVLDPFGGTGTTAHVAHALGRIGVTLDLSDAYCRLAADRTLARQRAAKVQGRVNLQRQASLFGAGG